MFWDFIKIFNSVGAVIDRPFVLHTTKADARKHPLVLI